VDIWRIHGATTPGIAAYFTVAVTSFLLNVLLFELLLCFTPLPYYVSLAIVLATVAFITLLANRLWAFRPMTGS